MHFLIINTPRKVLFRPTNKSNLIFLPSFHDNTVRGAKLVKHFSYNKYSNPNAQEVIWWVVIAKRVVNQFKVKS